MAGIRRTDRLSFSNSFHSLYHQPAADSADADFDLEGITRQKQDEIVRRKLGEI
jgi:hypothetical protein